MFFVVAVLHNFDDKNRFNLLENDFHGHRFASQIDILLCKNKTLQ